MAGFERVQFCAKEIRMKVNFNFDVSGIEH